MEILILVQIRVRRYHIHFICLPLNKSCIKIKIIFHNKKNGKRIYLIYPPAFQTKHIDKVGNSACHQLVLYFKGKDLFIFQVSSMLFVWRESETLHQPFYLVSRHSIPLGKFHLTPRISQSLFNHK